MIESVVADDGNRVLRFDGRLLASAVNPWREAEEWLQRRLLMIKKVKNIFVLGAGAGYHLQLLVRESSARILVIEHSAALIAAVRQLHDFDATRLQFLHLQKAKELRSEENVRKAVTESFLVLAHAPSNLAEKAFYQGCGTQLLGRDWGSLTWQWRLRGFEPLESQAKIHPQKEALTIYDLNSTELVQDSQERERMLFKALRELVK